MMDRYGLTSDSTVLEVGCGPGFMVYEFTRLDIPNAWGCAGSSSAIEGGKHAVCFSSGMATVDSCLKLLKAGDHVVCSDDVYGGVSRHFNKVLTRYGLSFTYVDTSDPDNVKEAVRSAPTPLRSSAR